ncbi:MAG: HYC_CC_PP family protein [Saprospiraceae bacterium]
MYSNTKKYKLFSLIMAILMFVTSAGFSLDIHYCKNELKSISLLGEAESCHDASKQKICPHHASMQKDRDCCENKTLNLKADIDKELDSKTFLLPITQELSHFIVAFVSIHLNLLPVVEKQVVTNHNSTRLIPRDIYILLETFLL